MKVVIAVLAFSGLCLAGCSQEQGPVGTKPSASSGTQGASSPLGGAGGTTPGTTPAVALPFVRGEIYGSCLRQFGANFQPTTADPDTTFPIQNCAATGDPTCAPGFQLVVETPVQMNCSGTPSSAFSPCYFVSQKCVKLAGADASEIYAKGKTYGLCLRSADAAIVYKTADTTAAFPITNCTTTAATTCASGFKVVKDAPVQMNCSPTPSPTSMVPCYYQAERCIRL